MTDQWVPAPPQPPPPDPPPGLPPANTWSAAMPCAAPDSPSIVGSIIITDVPATIVAPYAWGITLNDGSAPPNFAIDHFDGAGALIESPILIEGTSGDVMLTHDPTQPLGAATKEYVDTTGLREAPMDNTTYGRDNGAWVPLPASYMPEAPNTSTRFGRFNSTWQPDAIQTDAPSDGTAYARQNGAWTAAVTGGPYMPVSGGTFTGPVYFPSNNSVVINGAINTAHAILGQVAGLTRWQLQLPDMTTEGLGNSGANFSLTAFTTAGAFLGTWLTIARADGATTFGGSGVTVAGGLAVNGLLALASPNNLAIYGGTNGQVLATNGSGVLSWATRLSDAPSDGQFYTRQNAAWAIAPGGMTDAPSDGTAYARKSAAWAHLSHTDITDWTATLAPYALTASVPVASTTTPPMNGTAAVGTGTTWARADHVHPSDTSRLAISGGTMTGPIVLAANPAAPLQPATKQYVDALPAALGDNRIINGDMRIDQRNNGASGNPALSAYWLDRWQYGATQAGKVTFGRNLGPPGTFAPGFPYCLGVSSTSAYTPLAGDTFAVQQTIEADMISDLAWGTLNAQPVTLSFWALSGLTGTFSGSIRNPAANNRSYLFSYSLPSANTWTKIVLAIPGDTGGTWAMSGNAGALSVAFELGGGATYRGTAGAWVNGNIVGATGAVSVVATNAATFFVTGVKLEIGSVATPFNRQSLAKSMADCQRYYQTGNVARQGYATASVIDQTTIPLNVTMRASPTITPTWTTQTNCGASAEIAISPSATAAYTTVTASAAFVLLGTFTASAEL